jgi:hypothetical protein
MHDDRRFHTPSWGETLPEFSVASRFDTKKPSPAESAAESMTRRRTVERQSRHVRRGEGTRDRAGSAPLEELELGPARELREGWFFP